jgi:uncharacterized protein (TIGR03083 family)
MFKESGPTTPSATWWPADQTVGFWARRMAHETAVHRVDAELAAGESMAVDADLATDGIDELLRVMLEGDWTDDPEDALMGQRVAIETGGRRWLITLDRGAVGVSEGEGDADESIEGDPSDVLLWLWGRAADDAITTSGDPGLHSLLRERLLMATQ